MREKALTAASRIVSGLILFSFILPANVIAADGGWLPAVRRSQDSGEKININTASASDLERLPGIGPVLAERIIEHRRLHGPFKRPQDLIIVRGMSAARYRQIAHLIRI